MHNFTRQELVVRAFTHRSASSLKESYERLEFIGDRVLGLVIADLLLDCYQMAEEGELARRHTALVRAETLAEIAQECDFGRHMIVSDNKESMQNNTKILSDVLEACIGALFRDGGLDAVRPFVQKYFKPRLEIEIDAPKDAKTKLQEWSQKNKLGLPNYELIRKEGLDHQPKFIIGVSVDGYEQQIGIGASKQEASQKSAENFNERNNIK